MINSKRKKVLMHKLATLSMLLLDNLDDLEPDTPIMKKYKEDLTGFCEELTNTLAHTTTVQKTTYFTDMSNKIDTILRKNFEDN
jgi:hypothetical protein